VPITDVSIINMALSHLGHTIFIDDRNEDSNEVAVSNVHYDAAIGFVQEKVFFGFTRRFIPLGLVETDPTEFWQYSYRYPVNVVRIRRISTSLGPRDPAPPPFAIVSDDTGRLVYTNQADAVVEVSKLITNAALFTYMFAEAVSWWLASQMVPGLAKDPAEVTRCLAMAERLLDAAAASDGNESQDPPEEDSEAIRARQ
jgi:hypothetical protein